MTDIMKSIEEMTLQSCLMQGKSYASAHDFYEKEMRGRDFIVAPDDNEVPDAFKERLRQQRDQELSRLQHHPSYARRWTA